MKEFLGSAETVLIPKGDARLASVQAFQEITDIEVPAFNGEELSVESEGRVFVLAKAKDIPGLVASGLADIGMAGTDSVMESGPANLRVKRLSDTAMCRFSLLAPRLNAAYWRRGFDGDNEQMMTKTFPVDVLTSYPGLVRKLAQTTGFLLRPMDIEITGSVEGIARLLPNESFVVGDIVDTGETSRQNGLVEIRKMMDIYPEVMFVDQVSGTIKGGAS